MGGERLATASHWRGSGICRSACKENIGESLILARRTSKSGNPLDPSRTLPRAASGGFRRHQSVANGEADQARQVEDA